MGTIFSCGLIHIGALSISRQLVSGCRMDSKDTIVYMLIVTIESSFHYMDFLTYN